jgi:hypothetical protein
MIAGRPFNLLEAMYVAGAVLLFALAILGIISLLAWGLPIAARSIRSVGERGFSSLAHRMKDLVHIRSRFLH